MAIDQTKIGEVAAQLRDQLEDWFGEDERCPSSRWGDEADAHRSPLRIRG